MSFEQPPSSKAARRAPALTLKFWGVRGSIPTPGPGTVHYGGNTSCLEVRADQQIIILDAGTGLRLLGRQLQAEFGDEPLNLVLLLTHTHWDHIQGLPFFMPVYKPQNHLRILGFEGARNGLGNVLTSQMERPFFPIHFDDIPANVSVEELKKTDFNLGQVRIQAFPAYHPGTCFGYRLSIGGRSVAFFPDNELRHSSGNSAPSKDGQVAHNNKALVDFVRGTDLLVMDAQYDREEYAKHEGWGHGCMEEVVMLALDAQVKQLYLFHHDPEHEDPKISQMVAQARQIVNDHKASLIVEAAREGLTIELSAVG